MVGISSKSGYVKRIYSPWGEGGMITLVVPKAETHTHTHPIKKNLCLYCFCCFSTLLVWHPIRSIRIAWLDVASNQFTGPLPFSMDNVANLEWLDVQENMLSGSISSLLFALDRLVRLNVSSNLLGGTLPEIAPGVMKSIGTFFLPSF
jgi:hypothetical protein